MNKQTFGENNKSKYWSNKNKLKPNEVLQFSRKKIIFDCNICNHEFESIIADVSKGSWCSFCANQKLCNDEKCNLCFNKSFASHEKSKYWSNKNELSSRNVFKSSERNIIFNCNNCNHEFEIKPSSIIHNNSWCSYCSNKRLCINDSCKICFNKSFASLEKSKYFSNKNNITIRQIFIHSDKKYIFNCNNCNKELLLSSNQISKNKWCDICPKLKIKVTRKKNNILTFEKSFASHDKAKLWSNINKVQPIDIKKWSKNRYFFNCDKCNHIYEKSISRIMLGSNCDYCCEPAQKLCDNYECNKCLNKSFAINDKVKFWSDKNILKPRNVFNNSGIKYLFNCNKCKNDFECSPDKINNNRWCPLCKNKTELILHNQLKKLHPEIEIQYKPKWCKNILTNRFLPFDFVLKKYNIIIELDGKQHFEQVQNWRSPHDNLIIDKYKMKCANENNFSIIRILQYDVYNNKNDWFNILCKNIEKIIKEGIIQNIYMSHNNEYNVLQKL